MGVRLAALVPVLGLLLVGCTSSAEEPLPEPPPFTATPTPSAVAIEVPPSAQATDAVGAAQFARFYIQVLNAANESGEVASLRTVSHPECNACRDLIKTIETEEAAGKRFKGGQYQVTFAEADALGPDDSLVDVVFSQTASTTTDDSGKVLDTSPAVPRGALQMRVKRTSQAWVTFGLRFLEGTGQ